MTVQDMVKNNSFPQHAVWLNKHDGGMWSVLEVVAGEIVLGNLDGDKQVVVADDLANSYTMI